MKMTSKCRELTASLSNFMLRFISQQKIQFGSQRTLTQMVMYIYGYNFMPSHAWLYIVLGSPYYTIANISCHLITQSTRH